jgi:hypothetical protein
VIFQLYEQFIYLKITFRIINSSKMTDSNTYGSGEILLDKILVEEESATYKHSFLI